MSQMPQRNTRKRIA